MTEPNIASEQVSGAELEERMFLAAEIRDELAETTDLGYGERNRIAWDTVGPIRGGGESDG